MEETAQRACPRCGGEVSAGAKFCSACGNPMEPRGGTPPPARSKWYHSLWFILFMIFFVLGPLALPLVWKSPRCSRGLKIVLTVVTIGYTVWLVDLTLRMARAIMQEISQFNATLNF